MFCITILLKQRISHLWVVNLHIFFFTQFGLYITKGKYQCLMEIFQAHRFIYNEPI